jgi:hypothetical protein
MTPDMSIPLTPPDCNLRDFPFMPLDVARLRDSDLALEETPDVCWAALLLWSAAWHQVPAASLPDNDRALAKLAKLDIGEWMQLRERALRGFVKCTDGRLYHAVVAAKARESWTGKLKHAYDKLADRIRKVNKARALANQSEIPMPSFDRWLSIGRPMDGDLVAPEFQKTSTGIPEERGNESDGSLSKSALKGEGQGEGEGQGQGDVNNKTSGSIIVTGKSARDENSAPPDDDPAPRLPGDIEDEPPDSIPKDAGEWQRYFRERHGVELDANNVHHRTKAWPLFAAWVNAKVSTRQMDAAVAQAQREATGPIAFLPAYVDRVIASMQAAARPGRRNAQEVLEANNRRVAEELAEERRNARKR